MYFLSIKAWKIPENQKVVLEKICKTKILDDPLDSIKFTNYLSAEVPHERKWDKEIWEIIIDIENCHRSCL